MSIEKIIKKLLKEESEQVARISADDFKDILNYVNNDVASILRLPQYKNKDIIIDGDLDLSGNKQIQNLNLISKIEGRLNISNSSVDVFDDEKAQGVYDYNSKRYHNKRTKELFAKYEKLAVLRSNDEWSVQNGKEISYETEALYEYLDVNEMLVSTDEDGEDEDKYNIYPMGYKHYGGNMYQWLGNEGFEQEYVVYNEDKIHESCVEAIESRIDELGYEAFNQWVWESNLDHDEVLQFLREYISDVVYDDPENWGVSKVLTNQQYKYIEIYESKIQKLNQKLKTDTSLTDEQKQQLGSEIVDAQDLIDDIRENPEGDYDEDQIEGEIENWTRDNEDNFIQLYTDTGMNPKDIINYVDTKGIVDTVMAEDGYGTILGSYDGDYEEIDVENETYIVFRYN
jgi:hypothetical protein